MTSVHSSLPMLELAPQQTLTATELKKLRFTTVDLALRTSLLEP